MQSPNALWKLALLVLPVLLLDPVAAKGQWANSRGGPERDGSRIGTADLPTPQIKWVHELGGSLGTSRLWTIPDPVVPRVAIVSGGRVRLKRWDDSLSWQGQLFGLSRFIADADVDDDGDIDLLLAVGGKPAATLIGYTPEGEVAFTVPQGILGEVTTGGRVVDLDGDGFRDLFVTSTRSGPGGQIAAAFRLPREGTGEAELMYTIDPSHRDYSGGHNDVIAELDGSPGLEILSLGHRSIYVYDAATGALESEAELSGFVPFARATLRLVDLDRDGVREVFAFSDQAWSEANNRRHVTLLAFRAGEVVEVWTHSLGNAPDARLGFSDSSIGDLDGTPGDEIVFSVRSAGVWSTEVRDAATGDLLDVIAGERFADVVSGPGGAIVLTHDDNTPLRSYQFTRDSGLSQAGTHRDLRILRCRQTRAQVTETHRLLPCRLPLSGVSGRGVLAGEYDPRTNAISALVALDLSLGLSETARFDGRGGKLSGLIEIEPGHRAVIAVAHSDGTLLPLDEKLRFLAPSPKPPFSWAGVKFGGQFSGVDFASFPLVAPSADDVEQIVALTGAQKATVLDASGDVSVVNGVSQRWQGGSGNRIVVGDANGTPAVVVTDARGAMTALALDSGAEIWTEPEMFAADRVLHTDPLLVPAATGDQLWFHRRNTNTGIYDLTILDLANGTPIYSEPNLNSNDGGWKRLALATWEGEPAPISGRLGELWRFGADGQIAEIQSVTSSSVAIPVARPEATPLFIVDGLTRLAAIDPVADSVLWSVERNNAGAPRRGALLRIFGASKYATSEPTRPTLRIIDVESGVVDAEYNLVGGAIQAPEAPLPSPVPELGNVTAITDLTGVGDPAYLVGSSDGFIYAIHAVTGDLIWALFVAAQVGEIVPTDWDGDRVLELVASTADGTLLGIDRFTGDGPAWVHDTDGASLEDIDEFETESTLHVAWASIDGASSYEIAAFTNDGQPVTDGFVDVGNRTEHTLTGLDLEPGVRYVVSVRAISSLGISPDKPSDGVTIIPTSHEDPGGCCQVGTGGKEGVLETLILALLSCLMLRARRRRCP